MPRPYRTRKPRHTTNTLGWMVGIAVVIIGSAAQYRWMKKQNDEWGVDPIMTKTHTVPCYQCEGRGFFRESLDPALTRPCAVCFGVGHREILTDVVGRHICPDCNGMGREYLSGNHAEWCDTCKGWGLVLLTTYDEVPVEVETLALPTPEPTPEPAATPPPVQLKFRP